MGCRFLQERRRPLRRAHQRLRASQRRLFFKKPVSRRGRGLQGKGTQTGWAPPSSPGGGCWISFPSRGWGGSPRLGVPGGPPTSNAEASALGFGEKTTLPSMLGAAGAPGLGARLRTPPPGSHYGSRRGAVTRGLPGAVVSGDRRGCVASAEARAAGCGSAEAARGAAGGEPWPRRPP